MAPSYEIGNPQKSLVRIPGSGSDKNQKPICLEVAQITSFAKSDAFPNILRPPPLVLDNVARLQRLLPPQTTSPSGNQSAVASNASPNRGGISRKRTLESETCNQAKKTMVAIGSENQTIKPEDKTTIIKNLLRNKDKLEEENEELRKKIIMFKDLLRNKAKLEEFLVTINQQQIMA